jgi:hypothetical protein
MVQTLSFDMSNGLRDRRLSMDNNQSQGWTSLHWAVDEDLDGAIQNNEPVTLSTVKALIEAGADETARDSEGRTARDIAAAYGQKALRLYDAVSRVDWSGEPTLDEFTNRCQHILASAGYDARIINSLQISVSRDQAGHSTPLHHIFILIGEWYGCRLTPNFAERLLSCVREGLVNTERGVTTDGDNEEG